MKKILMTVLLASLVLMCAGCAGNREETASGNAAEGTETAEKTEKDAETFDVEKYLQELPDRPEERAGILICRFDGLHNEELWESFRKESGEGKECSLTIADITVEGDPIYTYLSYDGKKYTAVTDTSHDKFGTPETYRYERQNLCEIYYETEEETNGGFRPFRHGFAALSDREYTDMDEAVKALETEGNDFVLLWGYVLLMD